MRIRDRIKRAIIMWLHPELSELVSDLVSQEIMESDVVTEDTLHESVEMSIQDHIINQ